MPANNEVFVFGSNLGGYHGAGSALHALNHCGALLHVGVGRAGMSYAIPTKSKTLRVLPIAQIAKHVDAFLKYAADHTDLTFKVVAIGCGLAGFTPEQMAPLFEGAPSNVKLPIEFLRVLC